MEFKIDARSLPEVLREITQKDNKLESAFVSISLSVV